MTAVDEAAHTERSTRALYVAFIVSGATTYILGALMPQLGAAWNTTVNSASRRPRTHCSPSIVPWTNLIPRAASPAASAATLRTKNFS